MSGKLWGGRFNEETDGLLEALNASIGFDRRLALADLNGSVAHATMLRERGVINDADADAILGGLETIRAEMLAGTFAYRISREDIHMNVEARLAELIGPAAGRLHTARSRNDQVATDLRYFTRAACSLLAADLRALRRVLLEAAGGALNERVIMPGYTHLQVAQPILLAHWLLAYERMIARDTARLNDCRERLNESPLGAAALAGTSWPIDRAATAAALGFRAPMANSLDAVASRDFALEFLAAGAIAMTTLSRLAEELILYSSAEFGFLTLPDAFTTGSSIMPQKKNPDACELVRGKTGRVIGNLAGLLATVKGTPLAYNKDLQEDKEPIFDTLDTLHLAARTFAAMLARAAWRPEEMRRAAERGYSTATDLADTLARAGLPFRQAHEVVGTLVGQASRLGLGLDGLDDATLRAAHPLLQDPATLAAARAALSVSGSVQARTSFGGTAPERVTEALAAARAELEAAEAAAAPADASVVTLLPGVVLP